MNLTDTEQTRKAFDAAAPVYDALYESLPGIRRFRAVTARLYLKYFPRGSRLLEINCGTGNDAVSLAGQGYTIFATDISPSMVHLAREKATAMGLEDSVEVQVLPFDRLSALRGSTFDGAYSNLGGLNCTNDLQPIASGLADLLRPDGIFIGVVMPPFCLWETSAFLLRGKWRLAFRRTARGGTPANVHGGTVRTFYYSPRRFAAAFADHFDHVATVGLAVFLPPPNFGRTYSLLGKRIGLFERLDDTVAAWPLFRSIGDHYAIVLRRKHFDTER
ncbi:MAG: class I SAM-dependent methyltransferase [Bacteroidota bacterium]